jgi:hypothetical protein
MLPGPIPGDVTDVAGLNAALRTMLDVDGPCLASAKWSADEIPPLQRSLPVG